MNSPKYKFIIAAVIVIAATGAAGAVFTWLALHTNTITGNLAAIESELLSLEHERARAHDIETAFENNKDAIARVQSILVDHDRPLAFLDSLTNLSNTTHTKINIDYSEQESNASSLVFRTTIEGSRENVFAALKNIENMPYAVQVTDMNWQRIIPSDTQLKESIRLLLTIHVKAHS